MTGIKTEKKVQQTHVRAFAIVADLYFFFKGKAMQCALDRALELRISYSNIFFAKRASPIKVFGREEPLKFVSGGQTPSVQYYRFCTLMFLASFSTGEIPVTSYLHSGVSPLKMASLLPKG